MQLYILPNGKIIQYNQTLYIGNNNQAPIIIGTPQSVIYATNNRPWYTLNLDFKGTFCIAEAEVFYSGTDLNHRMGLMACGHILDTNKNRIINIIGTTNNSISSFQMVGLSVSFSSDGYSINIGTGLGSWQTTKIRAYVW